MQMILYICKGRADMSNKVRSACHGEDMLHTRVVSRANCVFVGRLILELLSLQRLILIQTCSEVVNGMGDNS
jgi:hypothetical protein